MQEEKAVSAEAWQEQLQELSGVTTEMLDHLGRDYDAKWELYEQAKRDLEKIKAVADEAEMNLARALKDAGKTKYLIEGLGTYTVAIRYSVPTPKTIAEKQALAKFLEEQGGKTMFWDKFSVNSQTLQSMYKAFQEEHDAKAEKEGKPELIGQFKLPGVGDPTGVEQLRFTKERVKAKK